MPDTSPQFDHARWTEAVHALADPARLRLLRLLERDEVGVAELCDVMQMPQSTVSRHLKLLSDDGWVVSRRQGTTNLYRMILDEVDEPARKLWLLAREQTEGWASLEQDRVRLEQRLRQRQGESRSFFAGVAGQWAETRDHMYGSRYLQHVLASLLPSDWVVADLGCGSGDFASCLAGRVAHVIGVDNSPEMLKAARARTRSADNIDLRQGELDAVPIDDNACDAALLLLVLGYVERPADALAEAARILKPSTGRVVIVTLMRHDRDEFRRQMGQANFGFERDELIDMLSAAGFTDVQCDPLPPEPDAKGPALLFATADKV